MYFPNQHYTGGDNPLASRAQEPLFLNGVATPRDAPVFGSSWYATYLWTEFGLKFIDEARQANKPFFLYLPFNAPHFPLMAPAELIAKYRGKYKAGWDRMRQERYQRQIRMGLIDAKWPLSPREPDTPPWDSLSDQQKDRFDHQMAVYAAMIEAIDKAVGTLVKGLEARGVLDNTLIFFMSDNGANAESGPDGRFNGDPPGGPNSDLYLGMNWAAVGNTPFRRFKHFTHEGGISSPLIVSWPRGIAANRRGAIERQPAHVIDIMATVTAATGAKYPSEYKGHAIQPMEGIICGRRSTAVRSTGRTRSSGSTKGTAPYVRATGRSSRCIPRRGSSTTSPPIASSATTSRPSTRTSSRGYRTSGTRGPNGRTWILGRVRRDCRGETTHRRVEGGRAAAHSHSKRCCRMR